MSDLYQEEIIDETDQYLVDGQLRDLKSVIYNLKVKGQNESEKFVVKFTHRGPVLSGDLIKKNAIDFKNALPILNKKERYSLVWGGHYPGESYLAMHRNIRQSKTLIEFKEKTSEIKKWRAMASNVVAADEAGNIAYMLGATAPQRKTHYPFVGADVKDGRSSKYDWISTVDFAKLPFVLNPEKGYFVTANDRIAPETSMYDIGADQPQTGRAIRLREIIEKGIKEGHKFTAQDMIDMQMDEMDVFARELTPHIISITEHTIAEPSHQFSEDDRNEIKTVLNILESFDGLMDKESIGATVYSYWQYFFYTSLFRE